MATQSILSPRGFTDPAIFAAEQPTLFERTWQFAGLACDVRNDKDFITGTVGRYPFVIQNFRGRLAALHNVCTHRSAPLQKEERGNRGLYCQYHGWTFDATGTPIGIPHNETFYGIAPEEAACLATKTFELEALGNLLFVSAKASGPLPQQMGEHHELLTSIGSALDQISFRTRIQAACNWKLLVHNAYDDIHAQFVHPQQSLNTSEYLSSRWDHHPFDAAIEKIPEDCSRRHARFSVELSEAGRQQNLNAFADTLARPAFAFDHYLHLVLFPNVIITSVQGLWYNIVRYRPTSPASTEIDLWVVPSVQQDGVSRVTPETLYRLAVAGLRIFQEDIEAVETSQRNMSSVHRHATLGHREDKTHAFDAAYVSALARVGVDAAGR